MYPESLEDKKIMSSDKWPIICPIYVMINYYDENEVIITTFIKEVHKIAAGGWWVSSIRITSLFILHP